MWATRFTVEGSGQFAFDMLRYDGCFPATEIETVEMMNRRARRKVQLITHHPEEGRDGLTDARWRSFGWRIVETEKPIRC